MVKHKQCDCDDTGPWCRPAVCMGKSCVFSVRFNWYKKYINYLRRSLYRRPGQDERRVRCRSGDGSASHHSPPQGAVLRPGGWEQSGVPEGEKHGTRPAAGLQHDGAEEEGLHDTTEPGQWHIHIFRFSSMSNIGCTFTTLTDKILWPQLINAECYNQHFKMWIGSFSVKAAAISTSHDGSRLFLINSVSVTSWIPRTENSTV